MKKMLLVETKLYLRDWPSLAFSIALPVVLLVVLGLTIPGMGEATETGGGAACSPGLKSL